MFRGSVGVGVPLVGMDNFSKVLVNMSDFGSGINQDCVVQQRHGLFGKGIIHEILQTQGDHGGCYHGCMVQKIHLHIFTCAYG